MRCRRPPVLASVPVAAVSLLDAGLASTSVTHGLLTPADIRRAVDGG